MLLALVACSDDDGGPAGVPGDGPVYALMTQVYDVDDRTVYLALSDTVDVDHVDLSDAREFDGVANFAPVGGRILVSDGEQPVITEFEITDDLDWIEGVAVSFADYPLYDNANFYYQFLLDEHTAYLPFEQTKRLLWDPTDMVIDGTVEDSSLALQDGDLWLQGGGNRNAVRFDGPVLQAFYYVDYDWFQFGPDSMIASYDPVTHAEDDVITAPCPGLSIATQDEAGQTYFGTWDYLGIKSLYGLAPTPCVARLRADRTLDEAFTTDLGDLTGGRTVSNFRYVGDGRAIGNVLHHELLGLDLDAPFDPASEAAAWATGPHWRLWTFDLDAGTAAPVEGIGVDIGSGAQFAVLDGRTFVFLPFDEWARTKVYELGDDGVAVERFEVTGDVFKWERVR